MGIVTGFGLVFNVGGIDRDSTSLFLRGIIDFIIFADLTTIEAVQHHGDSGGKSSLTVVNVADSTDVDVRLGSFESFLSHFFLLIGLLLSGYSLFSYFKPDITPVSHLAAPPSGLPDQH